MYFILFTRVRQNYNNVCEDNNRKLKPAKIMICFKDDIKVE